MVGWGHPLQRRGLGVVLLAAGRERFLSGERIGIFGGNSKSEKLWRKSRLRWLAGAWGFDWKKKKKALKLSTGSGHFSQNMNLVGGLTVVMLPIKTGRYHRFIPRLDLRVPGKRRPCPPPLVAEILVLMVHGRQRLGVAFPSVWVINLWNAV